MVFHGNKGHLPYFGVILGWNFILAFFLPYFWLISGPRLILGLFLPYFYLIFALFLAYFWPTPYSGLISTLFLLISTLFLAFFWPTLYSGLISTLFLPYFCLISGLFWACSGCFLIYSVESGDFLRIPCRMHGAPHKEVGKRVSSSEFFHRVGRAKRAVKF